MNTDEDLAPFLAESSVHKRRSLWMLGRLAIRAGYPINFLEFVEDGDARWKAFDPLQDIYLPRNGTIFHNEDCLYDWMNDTYTFYTDRAAEIYDKIAFITEHFTAEVQRDLVRFHDHPRANEYVDELLAAAGWPHDKWIVAGKLLDCVL